MNIELTQSDQMLLKKLRSLSNRSDIANLLELDSRVLDFLIDHASATYKEVDFKKKGGGIRKICIPGNSIKILQSKLLYVLTLNDTHKKIDPVHGFKKNRSILTNAKVHLGARELINFDLKDFFPTINFGRVRGLFMSQCFRYNNEVATTLAKLCCYKNQLPQGAPTSPFVANLIAYQLDNFLLKFSRKNRLHYTRYADDVTLSSKGEVLQNHCYREDDLWILSAELQSIVMTSGFEVNHKKTRYRIKTANISERLEVTNIIINEKLNVSRRYIKEVRSILNNWRTYGELDAAKRLKKIYKKVGKLHANRKRINLRKVVAGKLTFLKFVRGENDKIYRKYANEYLDLIKSTKERYLFDLDSEFELNTIIIRSGDAIKEYSSGFYIKGVGIITASHVVAGKNNIQYTLPVEGIFRNVEVITTNPDKDFALLLPLKYINDLQFSHFSECADLLKTPYVLENESAEKGRKYKTCGYPGYSLGMEATLSDCTIIGFRPEGRTVKCLAQEPLYPGNSGGPVFEFSTGQVVGLASRGGVAGGGGATEILPTTEIQREIKKHKSVLIKKIINILKKINDKNV